MNSGRGTVAIRNGGFPHSDTSGSTSGWQLPGAFRSLPRPSSPLSAKASTRCPSLALDPGASARKRRNAAAHRGKTPTPKRPHMKTLLRTHPARLRRARPPRSHDKLSLHPSINPRPTAPGLGRAPRAASLSLLRTGCERGGGERDRTDDLLLAKQALSQLSYTPSSEDRDQASGIRTAAVLIPDP